MTHSQYRQYICRACGLIYDEAEGDPDSGLAPGTRFEDIPDDWECPLCGVTKSDFELLELKKAAPSAKPATFRNATGIVVVGGGLAGWAAVEAIRNINTYIPVIMVTACSGDRYHKPELSIALSRGLTKKKLIRESAVDASNRLGIQLLSYTHATGLTPSTQQLRTTRGTLNYTHLILAQGARPLLPPQFDPKQCWRINNLQHWDAFSQHLSKEPQKIAIIGAGMVGCEIAEDISNAGHNVTLINRDSYPLAHILPEKAGMRLLQSLEQQGINYLVDSEVKTCSSESQQPALRFTNGEKIHFDQIIVATGLYTENRLAQQAGLKFDKGIVVNPQTMETSTQSIFALGDCVSINGEPCRFIEPIIHQARTIAERLLCEEMQPYQHQPPVMRLKTRALPVVIHGKPNLNQPWLTVIDAQDELVMVQKVGDEVRAQLRLQQPKRSCAA